MGFDSLVSIKYLVHLTHLSDLASQLFALDAAREQALDEAIGADNACLQGMKRDGVILGKVVSVLRRL